MSNPTGKTGKRLVEKTATGTRVFYRTADGRPSRTLDITPKGSKYFATATKREIEQAGGKVVRKRAGRKTAKTATAATAPKGMKYAVSFTTSRGTKFLGYARTMSKAQDMVIAEYESLSPRMQDSASYKIRKA